MTTLLIGLPTMGVAQSAPKPATTAALKAALRNDLNVYLKNRSAKEHLSGLSLSVSYGRGQAPINVTAGTTRFKGAPVTPTSLYQIGSNTKAFTAVAILRLEAQGRLSISYVHGRV